MKKLADINIERQGQELKPMRKGDKTSGIYNQARREELLLGKNKNYGVPEP